ncbi:hypothetical protein OAF73_01665, partial [Planctomycetota bacterium]|nr:hypothetical protein [Planctomycetota bacterium]
MTRATKMLRLVAASVGGMFVLAAVAAAQKPLDRSKPLTDPANDPYTRGGKEKYVEAAGYVSMGGFEFGAAPDTTAEVSALLPDVEIRWIETPHFELGIALPKVKVTKEERKKVKAELTKLRKALPDVKPDTKIMDPWLRRSIRWGFRERILRSRSPRERRKRELDRGCSECGCGGLGGYLGRGRARGPAPAYSDRHSMAYPTRTIALLCELLHPPIAPDPRPIQRLHNEMFEGGQPAYAGFQVSPIGPVLSNPMATPGAVSQVAFLADRIQFREEKGTLTHEAFAARVREIAERAAPLRNISTLAAQQVVLQSLVNPRTQTDTREFLKDRVFGFGDELQALGRSSQLVGL